MQEVLAKTTLHAKALEFKGVVIYIQSQLFQLQGNWEWDLHSDAVFCSDVIFALPAEFNGTRGIIYPDDVQKLQEKLSSVSPTNTVSLQFRIITTYGEVKTIKGCHITSSPVDELWELNPGTYLLDQEKKLLKLQKENEQLKLKREVAEAAERINQTGTWCFNITANSGWYSDQVFRIFGLPPQSLNAHLNTFTPFIHPDDKTIVNEAFDKAFKEQLPLQLHYRILTANGELKKTYQSTQWHYNAKGERIVSGIIRDETEANAFEQKAESLEQDVDLQKQFILLDEQDGIKGHWWVNLVTRKTVFSDSCYRMHGVKQKIAIAGINTFINYVHTDDQEKVAQAYKKMHDDQSLTELEFRIVRNEGRIRYIKQSGKTILHKGDPMIIGLMQDVTAQKQAEKKLKELREALTVRSTAASRQEEMTFSGNWIWELHTGHITWSSGLYNLLGYKHGSEELTQKQLLSLIYQEDRNKFSEALAALLKERQESEFEFRLMRQGNIRQMKASFTLLSLDGKDFFIGSLQDVSREHGMQQQLQQRIQLAESITENLLDRAVLTDNNNTVVIWNKACEKAYKIKKEEAIGKNIFELFPQLKNADDLARFHAALKGEEIHLMHVKATVINEYHNLSMVPLKDERENIWGVLHLIQDVTKEHELQRHLNDRLNFIESLVEASVDRIIVLDPDMNYILWNKKSEEYYGFKKEEIIGKNILEVFPEAINYTSYTNFKKALRGETVFIPAGQHETTEQQEEIYLIPIKNEKMEVTAVLCVLHDLSKDLELNRQKHKAFEILNALNENYFELDRNYQVSFVNQKGQEFFQMPKEEMLGKSLWSIFPYAVDTPVYYAITHAMEERVPVRGEFIAPTKNIPVLVSIAPTCDGIAAAFFDIQFIKDAQQQLQAEHERLKEAQAIGHIGSFEWNINTNQMIWNEELYKICGLPFEEGITFEKAFDFYEPEARDKLFDLFSYAVKTGAPFEAEERFRRTDGEQRHVFMRAAIVKNEAGEVQKLRGIVQDITDRRRLEAQTRENEYFLRQIEDITPDAIAVFDYESDETVYLNHAFATMTGYTAGELMEMGFERRMDVMMHPEDAVKIYELHRRMLSAADEDIETIQYKVIRKDGSECQIESRSKVFKRNESGQPTRILSVLQDVTQEIELNKALIARTQFIEVLADNSVDAVMVLDKNLRIVTWNRRCEEAFHIIKKEVAGRFFLELFPKLEEDSMVINALQRALAGESIHISQWQNIYTSGYSELFYVPLRDANNVVYGLLLISHDVTKRIDAEEELRELNRTLEKKNKELEEKQEEVTQFAFVASHDLKEPLRKIHTFSDFLLHKEDQSLSPANKSLLKKINAAVKRMELLIEDILVLTKINSEKRLEKTVDLNRVLKSVKEDMKDPIESSGAEIIYEKLPVIKGNDNQLFYLFKNLISNAIKFQLSGNKPVIRITQEIIAGTDLQNGKLDADNDYYKISVADNGLGFDPKYVQKIFGIFQRLHGKQEYEGTGIGLSICKKIMENHNGHIEASSTPGKGSVFSCYFEVN